MRRHISLIVVVVVFIALIELILWLVRPWFTYDRLYLFGATVFVVASLVSLTQMWRGRGNAVPGSDSPKVHLFRGIFFICIAIAILVFRGIRK